MPDETIILPIGFYLSLALCGVGMVVAFTQLKRGIGLPIMTVLATVIAWYFVDAVYNDYNRYTLNIGADMLDLAWGQVGIFVIAFLFFANFFHRWINKNLLREESYFMRLMNKGGVDAPSFQRRMNLSMSMIGVFWILLMAIAMWRTNFDFMGMFFPYISGKAYPWSRGRVGAGFDAIISLYGYVHVLLVSASGVIWALSKNKRTRTTAAIIFLLSAPWFLLDRVRNLMLATILPGLLAWVFVRFRGGFFLRVALLVGAFLVVDGWMRFVIQVRTEANVAHAFQQVGLTGVTASIQGKEIKHAGLNMFEELGWMNKFIEHGTFTPNWGSRYFAELVNPIPRVIWRDKPMIGIDYAIARGQKFGEAGDRGTAGVGATISTGMIGQGVVNFGRFFGPIAAALLMGIWAALLARQDLMGDRTGRLLLFFFGIVLTFNLGRDITLITLYPFVFGIIMMRVWVRIKGES
jgi:hypothetical protein